MALLGTTILVSPSASAWSTSSNIAVSTFGGTYREEPRALKIDSNGNIYSTGYFRGTVDFDPGDGVATLTSSLASIYLLKLDPSGNFLWAKSFGGSIGGNSGNTIAFDSAGNLYFGGNFAGTADFDPGAGTALVTAATGEDAFIVKLDSNGNYVWARSFGGVGGNANADGIGDIEIDSSGNVHAIGLFTGEVDFNPGDGTNNLLSISGTRSDFFILKLDSSGNFIWAKSFGIGGPPYGGTLSLDNDGNVYAAGIFYGSVDFDPGAGTALIAAAKTMDTFIVKLDALGNYRWANTYGGADSSANEDWIFSLANDASGNVFATGFFSGTVDFDRGPGVSNLAASGNSNDIFILKLNPSGEHLWSKKYGNSGSDGAWSIATDSNGNVYTTGGFTGEVNFNSGGTSAILTSSSNGQDTFILKLDSLGNYLWAKSFSGAGSDTGISISLDRSGNIYTAGIFSNTVDFNPGTGISNFLSNGDADIFIAKLDSAGNPSSWNNSSNVAVSVWGGTSSEEVRSMALDSNGNIYTTGYFNGTVDFDPSDGVASLTSAGVGDIFILKSDPNGNYLWVKRVGGLYGESAASIAVDRNGNVITTGNFSANSGPVDFDPGLGVANLTSSGDDDIFVLKVDSSGNYLWAKNMGGLQRDTGIYIAVDTDGSISATGIFSDLADFDPGQGADNRLSAGDFDIFISKFDSSGNHLWTKTRGGTSREVGQSTTFDGSGNIYSLGYFSGTFDFDPGVGVAELTSNGGTDMFISKFDSSGNYLWAKQIGGMGADGAAQVAFDRTGNLYFTGYFSGTVDFDPSVGVAERTSNGAGEMFIAKFDSSGNYIWAKRRGGSGADRGLNIALDSNGNIYSSGYFSGTVDFDPSLGLAELTSAGGTDIFIAKFDSSGNHLWAKRFGGTESDRGMNIAIDSNGNVFTSGYFSNIVDFDSGTGSSNFTSNGGYDVFILKLDANGNTPAVAAVTAGSLPNSKVAAIPSGVTEAAIAKTNELPAIKLNFGGAVPTAVTVAPVATNPAPAAVTPFVLSPSIKIVDIQLSGSFSGSATICLDGAATDRLYHFTNGAWVQLGSPSYANGQVCGVTTSFSPFTAAAPSPIPTAPSSVVATATGKRSATVNFTSSGSDGGSVITSYTATSTPGGITKTLVQATGGTFTFDGLQPSTSYTFDVTATNANGTSAAFTSNAIKTNTTEVASLTSITFTDDGTGTGGKLAWSGKNIDSVLYTGPTSSYPGAFNFGAFTSSWNGSIRNLTPETEYTISIYAISVDGIGESKSLTFKTGANLAVPAGSSNSVSTQSTSTQLFQLIIRWVNENTYVKGEAQNMTNLLNKFYALETSPYRSYIKVPVSRVSTVTATSLTPKSCSVVSTTAKVDAGLVKALTSDKCTISDTATGPSKATATIVKAFVFKKVAN